MIPSPTPEYKWSFVHLKFALVWKILKVGNGRTDEDNQAKTGRLGRVDQYTT